MAAEGEVVPIGLVKNEWGGSMIESWVPDVNPETGENYCSDRNTREGRTPGLLYNSMIMPMSNVTIKGLIWYQVRRHLTDCLCSLPAARCPLPAVLCPVSHSRVWWD